MKQVMEYFGGAIIAVVAALVVVSLFSGVPLVIGGMLEQSLGNIGHNGNSSYAFREYMNTPELSVRMIDSYDCRTGVWCEVEDYIIARNAQGDGYEVVVEEGRHESLQEAYFQISEQGTAFCCSHPGVYRITVRASGENGRITKIQLKLIVNGEVIT